MINRISRGISEAKMIELNFIFSLLVLTGMAILLLAAFYLQLFYHEIPCPLCLLQRVGYFGICLGIILNLRCHFSVRHEGWILLTTILLLIISVRQTLLDIYPRPGHEYIGSAIFGIHMPVWSIIVSVLLLLAYALRFIILGEGEYLQKVKLSSYPLLNKLALFLIGIIVILCAINLVSVFLQCGLDSCHTFSYRLLSN